VITKLEHVKCVLVGQADHPRRLWCGKEKGSFDWVFQDATHALLNAESGGRLLMCPDCAKAISAALEKGSMGNDPKGDAARLSLHDAAIDCGRAYEIYQTAGPDELEEARDLFHEAAHRLELVAKGAHQTAKGFLQLKSIQAVVRGQIKSTISFHGPITAKYVESATRRIAGGVLGHLRQASLKETSNEAAALEVKRLLQEIKDLQAQVDKKGTQVKYFIEKCKAAGIPLGKEAEEGPCSPT